MTMQVRDYFDRCADRFDGYYREKKRGLLQRAAHEIFRKPGLARRFQATADILGDVRGKTILDAGCGSGVYSIFFARQGARVTGLDFSGVMIALARKNAAEEGCAVEWVTGDFLEFPAGRRFDHLLFIGVFDYVRGEDAARYLDRARAMSLGTIVATFPKRYAPQSVIRSLWLRGQNCPVYYYTRPQVQSLADRVGLEAAFRDCGPIWTVAFGRGPGR